MLDFANLTAIILLSALTRDILIWSLAHAICGTPGELIAKPDYIGFAYFFKM